MTYPVTKNHKIVPKKKTSSKPLTVDLMTWSRKSALKSTLRSRRLRL